MLPIGAFLALSLGRSFRRPVRALLEATEQIEGGDFAVDLRSDHNDELGYLIDRTADMATGLKEKQLISDTFGKVVDPRVRDHLLEGNIALGGARRDAAVLFCDIRGFTTFSEVHDEGAVVTALNEHLAEMERCIVEQGGMINKFLGDGLLALFGLPIATENPAVEAYAAARRMLEVNHHLNLERRIVGRVISGRKGKTSLPQGNSPESPQKSRFAAGWRRTCRLLDYAHAGTG
jgi:adenylate cyclase